MPRNNYFQFKRFRVVQEKAAMRISTDGVLIGAWAELNGAGSVLDVGTGTGIIALMAAQRSEAHITGIEIEENAAIEASLNAASSPWSHRISIQHISFQDYVKRSKQKFDRIISNPPYFLNDKRPSRLNHAIARHGDTLSIKVLAEGAAALLSEEGTMSLILPVLTANKFRELAKGHGLFLKKLTEVRHAEDKPVHRHLMEFGRKNMIPVVDNLTVTFAATGEFSDAYRNLTRDFYLNF